MSRRHRGGQHEEEEIRDLNLVPYLDIMVNLIMFMLVTYQVVVELNLIQVNAPTRGGSNVLSENPDEKPLILTVAITAQGFRILTTDVTAGTENIPMKGTEYDYEELTVRLERIKAGVKVDSHLIVTADPNIVYEKVVGTLDAARKDTKGDDLFPKVTFGMAMGG